ncbi:MAG: NCS2 family permease [Lentisphaerae bacterium]|nr:NCS2 family permease [Lentisphaerota bacterium]
MLERLFNLRANNTSARTEALAGLTTFLTMAYIIFVQPAVLSGSMFGISTGMDAGAVMTATCLSAAAASAIMGLYGRYPIALAPGMGENFFFVFSVIPAAAAAGFAEPWRVALGVVFISGVLFYAVYLLGIRERIFDAISPGMKNGMAAGIGLFIAFIGLQNAGLVVADPGTAVKLNPAMAPPDLLVFATGLVVAAALQARRVRGAILIGIAAASALAVCLRLALPCLPPRFAADSMLAARFTLAARIVSPPPSLAPTLLKMDLVNAVAGRMWPFIILFLFMDTFDTIGTLIGVGEQAGFIRDNRLPRARQAMLADQAGTLIGACLGAGTTTSYIESAAGVAAGGRTGLTSLVTAACFLAALLFSPVIAMISSYPPITASALVVIGALMMRNASKVDWSDHSEAIPAFLVVVGIPFTYSIADGLALGFLAYPAVKLLSGRGRQIGWLMYVLGAVLALYFIFVRPKIA